MDMLRRFAKDPAGSTAIEYGLIAALISVAMMTALGLLGNNISNTFTLIANKMITP
jgi:pilus assembly protein Flp/PilA